jgi:calcium-dependent protein kinase
VLKRIKNFRQPKRLQIEALTFLVNQVDTSTFDFAKLRNAFRTLDTDNSGTLQLSEIRTAFQELHMSEQEVNSIFERIDFNHDGEINYSEFLAVTVDRRKAITENNMLFAFHHFDIDNSGFITEANLEECFRREGKHLTHNDLQEMLTQVSVATPG